MSATGNWHLTNSNSAAEKKLQMKIPEMAHTGSKEAYINNSQKHYYDRDDKVLPNLREKDTVRLHDQNG